MKKIFVLTVFCIHFFCGFSQVVPTETLKKKNYQVVKLFDVDKGEFSLIERFAMYPNGKEGINQFIVDTFKYPKKAKDNKIEGVVVVQFTVNIKGSVVNVKVIQSAHPLLNKEAVRVIKKMDKWEPAYQGGQPVKSTYTQLFNFKL